MTARVLYNQRQNTDGARVKAFYSLRRLPGRISPKRKLPIKSTAKTNANAAHDLQSNPTNAATKTDPFRKATFNLLLAPICCLLCSRDTPHSLVPFVQIASFEKGMTF
jgi:hypothetical protein